MALSPPDDRPAQPRDPELWNRTRAAVHAAGAALTPTSHVADTVQA